MRRFVGAFLGAKQSGDESPHSKLACAAHVKLLIVDAFGKQVDTGTDGGRRQGNVGCAGVGQIVPVTPGARVAGDVDRWRVAEVLDRQVALAIGG